MLLSCLVDNIAYVNTMLSTAVTFIIYCLKSLVLVVLQNTKAQLDLPRKIKRRNKCNHGRDGLLEYRL